VTWVKVSEGQAVNHNGRQFGPGIVLDVEDRLAVKWLERQVVLPARPPVKKATKNLRLGADGGSVRCGKPPKN
jgi:hypothetical protein